MRRKCGLPDFLKFTFPFFRPLPCLTLSHVRLILLSSFLPALCCISCFRPSSLQQQKPSAMSASSSLSLTSGFISVILSLSLYYGGIEVHNECGHPVPLQLVQPSLHKMSLFSFCVIFKGKLSHMVSD